MSRTYFDLSALAAAAKANDCTVHLHQDEMGCPIFSIGNSNTGAREFASFDAAMKFVIVSKFTEADCAAQAGAAIADNCLNGMLDLEYHVDRSDLLASALADLVSLKHSDYARVGFARALLPVIDAGLGVAK